MQVLATFADIASIVGLVLAMVTLILVGRLRTAVKRHSRHKLLREIIDRVLALPEDKKRLPESKCDEVRFVIRIARRYERFDRKSKQLLDELEGELSGERRLGEVQRQLQLLIGEFTLE
jgi:hypothetical protein